MYSKNTLLALAAASAVQASAPQGFNYGSTMNGAGRTYDQFSTDFKAAQALKGAPGTFNSARLYTMIDGVNPGTADNATPISALQAAADTKTQLLLGLWMSGSGQDMEISALQNALKANNAKDLAPLILGISVGSEDLYRISPTGLAAPDAAPGSGPDLIVKYIKKVRDAIKGTPWENVPVGHVDTWTAWVNGSNSAVIDNSDFLGVDAYPYWQNTQANAVSNGAGLFNEAMDNTKGVSNGKPVWITETGWAATGPTEGQAVAGIPQSQQYWDDVACPNLGNTPTFWYTLYDGVANGTQTPSFSVTNEKFEPLFDLSCSGHTSNSTSTSNSSSSGSSTGSASTSTGTGSSSGSGASNGTYTGTPSQPSSTAGSSSGGYGSSGSGSGSGSSSSGSGSGSSSSGSGSSSSGSSSNGTAPISTTNGAGSLSFSLGSAAAIAAAVVAFL